MASQKKFKPPKKQPNKVSRACKSCRKRKIKCSGVQPCSNCLIYKCSCEYNDTSSKSKLLFYKDNKKVFQKIEILHSCIQDLKSSVPSSLSNFEQLSSLELKLKEFQSELTLGLDTDIIRGYEEPQAMEQQLIGTETILFNKFSTFSPAKQNNSALHTRFGLYSPLLMLSLTNIGQIIKSLFTDSEDCSTTDTIYLILKFFDVGTTNFQKNLRKWYVPLEVFSKMYHPNNELNRSELIQSILSKVPAELLDKCGVTMNPNNIHPCHGFQYSVKLLDMHHSMFYEILNDSDQTQKELQFSEREELLSILCLEFFQKSLFAEPHSIDYIESLILFLKNIYWIDEVTSFGNVISIISRLCQDNGLSRWEYYLGLTEKTADKHRQLWWDCCWWDKWYSVNTGKQPLVSDEMVKCLFPRVVMELGVDDSMNYETLLLNVQVKNSETEGTVKFIYILLSKIIGDFFSSLLFNCKFTDYKLHSGYQYSDLDKLAKDFESKVSYFMEVFTNLEKKFISFFEENLESVPILELYIQIVHVRLSCSMAAINMMLRIRALFKQKQRLRIEKLLEWCKESNFQVSKKALLKCLRVDGVYKFWRSNIPIITIFLNFSDRLIENQDYCSTYHLSLLCSFAKHFNQFEKIQKTFENGEVKIFQDRFEVCKMCFLMITRICLQMSLKSQNISQEQLLENMEDVDSVLLSFCEELLNSHSELFKCFFIKEKSSYHSVLLKHLQKTMSKFSPDSFRDISQNNNEEMKSMQPTNESYMANPNSPHPTFFNASDSTIFENFLNLTSHPELQSSFWTDILSFGNQDEEAHDWELNI